MREYGRLKAQKDSILEREELGARLLAAAQGHRALELLSANDINVLFGVILPYIRERVDAAVAVERGKWRSIGITREELDAALSAERIAPRFVMTGGSVFDQERQCFLVPEDAVGAAVKAERERCADKVDGWHIKKGGYTTLAAAIRAEGKP